MKLYCRIEKVLEHKGKKWAKCKDLNDKTDNLPLYKIIYKDVELKEGVRYSLALIDTGRVIPNEEGKDVPLYGCSEILKEYPEKKSGYNGGGKKGNKDVAITLGNAISVATNLVANEKEEASPETSVGSSEEAYEKVLSLATTYVYPKSVEARESLSGIYKELMGRQDEYAVGARWGQCLIVCSHFTQDIDTLFEKAKGMFVRVCEEEKKLNT